MELLGKPDLLNQACKRGFLCWSWLRCEAISVSAPEAFTSNKIKPVQRGRWENSLPRATALGNNPAAGPVTHNPSLAQGGRGGGMPPPPAAEPAPGCAQPLRHQPLRPGQASCTAYQLQIRASSREAGNQPALLYWFVTSNLRVWMWIKFCCSIFMRASPASPERVLQELWLMDWEKKCMVSPLPR